MRRSKVALFLLSLLVVATIAVDTRAQAVYGSIAGTVTDSSGAVVPDATVTIRSVERNTSDTVQTNDSGVYIKDRLLPGVYEVKVEKAGYKQAVLASVTVNLDAQAKRGCRTRSRTSHRNGHDRDRRRPTPQDRPC